MLVDEADVLLVGGGWSAYEHSKTRYAVRPGAKRIEYMHGLILPLEPPLTVDHINGDGLDNRRSNLRPATKQQQMWNASKRKGCISTFKGVSWDRERGRWQTTIRIENRSRNLGRYSTELEAALAYDCAAIGAFGEYARLNFPLERAA